MSLNRATAVLDCLLKGAWTPWTPFSPSSGCARHVALNDNYLWRFWAPPTGNNTGNNYWCLCTGPHGSRTAERHRSRKWEVCEMWVDGSRDRSRENCVRKQASTKPFHGGGKHRAAAKYGRLVADGHFSSWGYEGWPVFRGVTLRLQKIEQAGWRDVGLTY